MKLKILKTELIFQIVVILACFIWFISGQLKSDGFLILLYILPILAISNILGFLVRIFTYQSRLMVYYFFGAIFYLLILGLMGLIDQVSNSTFFKIYLFGGSLLISLYYTISGFFIIRENRESIN